MRGDTSRQFGETAAMNSAPAVIVHYEMALIFTWLKDAPLGPNVMRHRKRVRKYLERHFVPEPQREPGTSIDRDVNDKQRIPSGRLQPAAQLVIDDRVPFAIPIERLLVDVWIGRHVDVA